MKRIAFRRVANVAWASGLTAVIAWTGPLAAQPSYTATRIFGPPNSTTFGAAINASGQVAGWRTDRNQRSQHGEAFLFSGGVHTDLGTFNGGRESRALGLNDAGHVVGLSEVAVSTGTTDHAFLRTGAGSLNDINPPGARLSIATAINASGVVVGTFVDAGGTPRGFNYQNNGFVQLPSLGGGITAPTAINASRKIVGGSVNGAGQIRAFARTSGPLVDLGTFGGATSVANALNSRGDVVGSAESPTSPARAFIHTGGPLLPLGTLGGNTSTAYGINDANQIVGQSTDGSGAERAFLHMNGSMIDLNTLVASGLVGGVLTTATGINASGQIVAQSCTSPNACATYKLSPLTPGKARAIEYYHAAFDHYFITIVDDEITKLDNGTFVGWTRTGEGIDVDAAPQSGNESGLPLLQRLFCAKELAFLYAVRWRMQHREGQSSVAVRR